MAESSPTALPISPRGTIHRLGQHRGFAEFRVPVIGKPYEAGRRPRGSRRRLSKRERSPIILTAPAPTTYLNESNRSIIICFGIHVDPPAPGIYRSCRTADSVYDFLIPI